MLRIASAVVLLLTAALANGQAPIFSFVDSYGVLHLSNVDEDRRHASGTNTVPDDAARDARRAIPRAIEHPSPFHALIGETALRFGVDAALLHAVIAVESAFDPNAVSSRGAGGLMQLMPDTARRYGVADVFDPGQNVRGGAQYLKDLMSLFDDDLSLTLAAYHAGEGAVLRHGHRIPPYRDTVAYVPKAIAAYRKYRFSM